jgi:autophagy-related protein 18
MTLCMLADLGGFNIVEMLFGTNLLAIVGTGEQVPRAHFLLLLFYIKYFPILVCDCVPRLA